MTTFSRACIPDSKPMRSSASWLHAAWTLCCLKRIFRIEGLSTFLARNAFDGDRRGSGGRLHCAELSPLPSLDLSGGVAVFVYGSRGLGMPDKLMQTTKVAGEGKTLHAKKFWPHELILGLLPLFIGFEVMLWAVYLPLATRGLPIFACSTPTDTCCARATLPN